MPQQPGRPEHGDFHEEIHAHAEEKGQPRGKVVDVQTGFQGGAHILQPVGQGKGQSAARVGAGFHHMVAADADSVELGHVLGAMGNDVGHDAHGGRRRIDIGVAGQIFFENVVLNGAA